MVKCGNCGLIGHNRRTCPSGAVAKKAGSRRVSRKKTIESIKLPTREEALVKLKKIKETRLEQDQIANKAADALMNNKHILIKAEEKTGKRCILEAIHLMMIINHYSNVPDKKKTVPRSIYITALNRKDTKVQFEEQEDEYGILSVSTKMATLCGDIINILRRPDYDGMIYIHLDECDYGTGADQALSTLYNSPELQISEYRNRIRYVAYSATPEELEYSGLNETEWVKLKFTPNKNYFGAEKYLERDLVRKPDDFYDGEDITEHGAKIIKDIQNQCKDIREHPLTIKQRNVVVVRDTKNGNLAKIKNMKSILEGKYNCEIHVYDQKNGFQWGNPDSWAQLGREEMKDDNRSIIGYKFKPVVIFISQICTRSTEICPLGHRKIYAWHDSRKLKDRKAYNTLSQAIGRIKHYTQQGHPENNILLYCDKDILNYTLGRELNTEILKLGARVSTVTSSEKKWKFEDDYERPDEVNEDEWFTAVPDSDGQELPEYLRTKYNFRVGTVIGKSGKWVHSSCENSSHNQWGKLAGGVSTRVMNRCTINYESNTSNRFLVRKAVALEEIDNSVSFTHTTKSSSMYVVSDDE